MGALEENRRRAVEFFTMAFEGNPVVASSKYIGDRYIQHNPSLGDGIVPFIEYFEKLHKKHPHKEMDVIRTITEKDLVTLHTRQILSEGNEYVTMEIFRFDEKGKIVEHWNISQKIPEKSLNSNTMY